MADPTVQPAQSLYVGVRATITASADPSRAWLTLAAKPRSNHWSDWDAIVPAIPVDMSSAGSTREALIALADAIMKAADNL